MAGEEFCGKCGNVVHDDPTVRVEGRTPCPNCGSTSRHHRLEGHVRITISVTANLTVIGYPQALITTAKDLASRKDFGIAIVVAHMGCEVAVERAMPAAFSSKQISYLEDPISEFLNGYNLGNTRNRKLFSALTGNDVEKQTFWGAFSQSAVRRNKMMHAGHIANESEANETLNACESLIANIQRVIVARCTLGMGAPDSATRNPNAASDATHRHTPHSDRVVSIYASSRLSLGLPTA